MTSESECEVRRLRQEVERLKDDNSRIQRSAVSALKDAESRYTEENRRLRNAMRAMLGRMDLAAICQRDEDSFLATDCAECRLPCRVAEWKRMIEGKEEEGRKE